MNDVSLVLTPDVEVTICVTLSHEFHLCLHKKDKGQASGTETEAEG